MLNENQINKLEEISLKKNHNIKEPKVWKYSLDEIKEIFYEPNEIVKINSIVSKVLWEETETFNKPKCFKTVFFHNKNPKKFQIIVQRNFKKYSQLVTLLSIKYFDSINTKKDVSGNYQKNLKLTFK
jgi:hypothetical protein